MNIKVRKGARTAASLYCRATVVPANRKHIRFALAAAGILFGCTASMAGEIAGSVADTGGRPLPGAMVTLTDARGVGESVFADAQGAFRLKTGLSGTADLRVRMRYYADGKQTLNLDAPNPAEIQVRLAPLTDPKAISDDHPSLSHFARIAFDADERALFSRANFTRDCLSCHSLGDVNTRRLKTLDEWKAIVQRMHGYLGNRDEKAVQARAEKFAAAFNDALVSSKPVVPFDAALTKAKIYQWRLKDVLVPHDPLMHTNGLMYIVDMMGGALVEMNLKTGATRAFPETADGMPPGGIFAKMGVPAPYGMTLPRASHSLAESTNGKLYLTDLLGSSIAEFDPRTEKFSHYDIGSGAIYPHTIRADQAGVLWFTIAFSNQVGRFDPATRDMKVIKLPDTPSLSIVGGPSPYGIDVHPNDGGIWYAKLAADKIGRIDPKTLEVKEYDSPVRGPRRLRFDAAGNLWVAGFSEGAIARIDVDAWKVKVYRLPQYAPGEVAAPYAVAVHPKTQEVWVNDTMLDLVWRFLPKEERFIAYPMPMKRTYTREFTFTPEGLACTTNNTVSPAFIEGGFPELICIDAG